MTDEPAITTTLGSEYDTTTFATIYCRRETQGERYLRLSNVMADSCGDGMARGVDEAAVEMMASMADALAEASELHAALERFA